MTAVALVALPQLHLHIQKSFELVHSDKVEAQVPLVSAFPFYLGLCKFLGPQDLQGERSIRKKVSYKLGN